MENNCQFVNSHGILKSCDFHTPKPISSWCYQTEYLDKMIEEPQNMFDNMSIYVCTDVLPYFLENILPKMNNDFFLVSGDSDATVPNGHYDIWGNNIKILDTSICYSILRHPRLIKWFAQNCIFTNNENDYDNNDNYRVFNIVENNKIFQLPIGLDYHTIGNNPSKFWRDKDEGYSAKFQENILKTIRKTMKPFHDRINKIFVQMSLGGDRTVALNQIPENLIKINLNAMPRTQVWKEIVNYTFAFSPYGNGPDCHRHWEILALGCIPIIRSFGRNDMFDDFPVLIVDEWSDITEQLLVDTIEKFKVTKFNYDKLLLQYWVNQFSTPP